MNNVYEQEQINQFYPDLDNMTQEEIFKLQQKIGYEKPN